MTVTPLGLKATSIEEYLEREVHQLHDGPKAGADGVRLPFPERSPGALPPLMGSIRVVAAFEPPVLSWIFLELAPVRPPVFWSIPCVSAFDDESGNGVDRGCC